MITPPNLPYFKGRQGGVKKAKGGMVMKRGIVFFGILVFLLFGGWALGDPLEQGKKSLAEGLRAFQKEPLLRAKRHFEELLKSKKDDPQLYYLLAQSLDGLASAEELQGNKDGAFALIEEGVKAAKRNASGTSTSRPAPKRADNGDPVPPMITMARIRIER